MQIIIIAPHPDDEIIGCWEILNGVKKISVFYPNGADEGALRACSKFKFNIITELKWDLYCALLAPDPIFETHPDHRQWGHYAENILRKGWSDVFFYSVNMQAPYIKKTVNPEKKKADLNACYPEKYELWKYDHKYFLFEGRCSWNPIIG